MFYFGMGCLFGVFVTLIFLCCFTESGRMSDKEFATIHFNSKHHLGE